jgi:hypothetical protein
MPQRRRFIRLLLGEAASFVDEMGGTPQLRLDQIPDLPDEKLARLIPVVVENVRLGYAAGVLTATIPGKAQPMQLFATNSTEFRIFNCFDGARSLEAVCLELAPAGAQAVPFAQVKECFLKLVSAGVCVPANFIL